MYRVVMELLTSDVDTPYATRKVVNIVRKFDLVYNL